MTNIFNETTNRPIRNTYPLCGQYPNAASLTEKMYLNCSSTTLPGRFVIIQQPLNGTGLITICELEVYGFGECSNVLFVHKFQFSFTTAIEQSSDHRLADIYSFGTIQVHTLEALNNLDMTADLKFRTPIIAIKSLRCFRYCLSSQLIKAKHNESRNIHYRL